MPHIQKGAESKRQIDSLVIGTLFAPRYINNTLLVFLFGLFHHSMGTESLYLLCLPVPFYHYNKDRLHIHLLLLKSPYFSPHLIIDSPNSSFVSYVKPSSTNLLISSLHVSINFFLIPYRDAIPPILQNVSRSLNEAGVFITVRHRMIASSLRQKKSLHVKSTHLLMSFSNSVL